MGNCYEVAQNDLKCVMERIKEVWGPGNREGCPWRTERREKIFEELRNAYCATTGKFITFAFNRFNDELPPQIVCELCYVDIMGVVRTEKRRNSVRPSRTWEACNDAIVKGGVNNVDGLDQWRKNSSSEIKTTAKKPDLKLQNALFYIYNAVTSAGMADNNTAYAGNYFSSYIFHERFVFNIFILLLL